ncbi:MAG: hypothetical protein ABJB21_05795 [bacterium]
MSRLRLPLFGVVISALVIAAAACQQTTPPANQSTTNQAESKEWDSYVNEFLEAHFVENPEFAVRAGRHELKYGGPPIPLVRKATLPGDTGSLF